MNSASIYAVTTQGICNSVNEHTVLYRIELFVYIMYFADDAINSEKDHHMTKMTILKIEKSNNILYSCPKNIISICSSWIDDLTPFRISGDQALYRMYSRISRPAV